MLKVRALRRHHYFRKLKNQQLKFIELNQKAWEQAKSENSKELSQSSRSMRFNDGLYRSNKGTKDVPKSILAMKKVRLTEEGMSYEDLAVLENFSDDEITYELNREIIKNRKDQKALQKAKILRSQIKKLKRFSFEGMRAILDTISSIDDSSKKILFKHFDQSTVNHLRTKAPDLKSQLSNLADETQNTKFHSDV